MVGWLFLLWRKERHIEKDMQDNKSEIIKKEYFNEVVKKIRTKFSYEISCSPTLLNIFLLEMTFVKSTSGLHLILISFMLVINKFF